MPSSTEKALAKPMYRTELAAVEEEGLYGPQPCGHAGNVVPLARLQCERGAPGCARTRETSLAGVATVVRAVTAVSASNAHAGGGGGLLVQMVT